MFLFYHSLILSALCGFLVIRMKPYYASWRAQQRRRKLQHQFKDMLYSLSASFTAGRQMPEALVEAADTLSAMYGPEEPIMMELAHMKRCILENNESDSELLTDFAARSGCEDISNFVQVYIICRNTGGDLEKNISRTVSILTDKMNIEREIQSLTSQKKFEGRLIALMPLAMLVILNLLSFLCDSSICRSARAADHDRLPGRRPRGTDDDGEDIPCRYLRKKPLQRKRR